MAARFPLHVTSRFVKGLPSARAGRVFRVIRGALRDKKLREGFRLVHFSVQSNHVHMLVEARDEGHLARGMQSVLITIAKRLNRWWGRKGRVIEERYHDRVLRTPREVQCALAYVLCNARRHGIRNGARLEGRAGARAGSGAVDPCSSGPWFDGWRELEGLAPDPQSPVARARSWLLLRGWCRHGLVSVSAIPGPG